MYYGGRIVGSFSWLKAEKNYTGWRNIQEGEPFKFLIPLEFGGGSITDDAYQDYGRITCNATKVTRDIYEIMASMNVTEDMKLRGSLDVFKPMDDDTDFNRGYGIDVVLGPETLGGPVRPKYPLKLVSHDCELTYEEVEGISYDDPYQGCAPNKEVYDRPFEEQDWDVEDLAPELRKESLFPDEFPPIVTRFKNKQEAYDYLLKEAEVEAAAILDKLAAEGIMDYKDRDEFPDFRRKYTEKLKAPEFRDIPSIYHSMVEMMLDITNIRRKGEGKELQDTIDIAIKTAGGVKNEEPV